MGKFLVHKTRMEQLNSKLWITLDNQLFELDNGRIILAPRKLVTDNNTNPFGDNDLCDVRASHFHDLGCRYHKLIYVSFSQNELIKKGYIKEQEKSVCGCASDIKICTDIEARHLFVEKVGFNQVNAIFKEMLNACEVGKFLASTMRIAVNFNIGWLFSGKKELKTDKIYKDFI